MLQRALSVLIDTLLPPHDVVNVARNIPDAKLAELMEPKTVGRLTWVHALLPYSDEGVRALIKSIKYYDDRTSAKRVGVLAADYVLEVVHELRTLDGWDSVLVVPIATSRARRAQRGYNQTERVARAIAKASSLPYADVLTRDDRQSQVHVPRRMRKSNIAGAFRAGASAEGHHIILIDDVVESGATLVDAKRALTEAGARGVIAIALAH